MLTRGKSVPLQFAAGILFLAGALGISAQGTNDTKPIRANSLPGVVFLTPRFTTRSVGIDSQGNFVVIWRDETRQGKTTGVYARAFDAKGSPRGLDIPVFVNAEACADGAAVAVDPTGWAVIVWTQLDLESKPGLELWAQRLNKDGKLEGKPLRLNPRGRSNRNHPSVAYGMDGTFVVVWTSVSKEGLDAVFARRFDPAGLPLSGEIQVSTNVERDACDPSVAVLPDGKFAVAFAFPEPNSTNICLRLFDSSGKALSSETRTNADVNLRSPSVTCDKEGRLLAMAWQSYTPEVGHVLLRIFDASGRPRTAEKQVDTLDDQFASRPTVAFSGDRILVGWGASAIGLDNRVLARYFFTDGRPEEGVSFWIDNALPGGHSGLSISANSKGDAAAVWDHHVPDARPSIMARRWTWPGSRGGSSRPPSPQARTGEPVFREPSSLPPPGTAAPPARMAQRPDPEELTKTTSEMRRLGVSLEAYAVDYNRYPLAPDVPALAKFVEPTYIERAPLVDGWGTPFAFVCDGNHYRIVSAGADRTFEPDSTKLDSKPAGRTDSLARDLIFSDGSFIQWPGVESR